MNPLKVVASDPVIKTLVEIETDLGRLTGKVSKLKGELAGALLKAAGDSQPVTDGVSNLVDVLAESMRDCGHTEEAIADMERGIRAQFH